MSAHQIVRAERPHGLEYFGRFALHGAVATVYRRLHGQQGDDLEDVVLDYIAQATRRFIKGSAPLDAEFFRERDLNAIDIVPVPDRLEKGVGEAKVQNVHDRFFAQIVVDPEDRPLWENGERNAIEFARGGKITAERLLHDDTGVVGKTGVAQSGDQRFKQARRNRQVVNGTFRVG